MLLLPAASAHDPTTRNSNFPHLSVGHLPMKREDHKAFHTLHWVQTADTGLVLHIDSCLTQSY